MNEVVIDDSQREMCAVLVMRTMLTDYCNDTGVSFNDVFFRFVTSPAYKMLFDYSTGLWMEGPDYLRNIFEDTPDSNRQRQPYPLRSGCQWLPSVWQVCATLSLLPAPATSDRPVLSCWASVRWCSADACPDCLPVPSWRSALVFCLW